MRFSSFAIGRPSSQSARILYHLIRGIPVLYRRKLLLALLQSLNGKADVLQFQKVLFLLTLQLKSRTFEFVPYHKGCFSFQANSEMKVLERQGFLFEEDSTWHLKSSESWAKQLTPADRLGLVEIVGEYGSWNNDKLVHWTYTQHPYYAINSKIIDKHLNHIDKLFVETARPVSNCRALYTTGYEGLSLEGYLNRLIKLDVKVLCDVRRNPVSMKYGFSRRTLQKACEGVHIEYLHFPELGIESELRKELKTKQDYEDLFKIYDRDTLPRTLLKQDEIADLVRKYDRVALTCFEADPSFCHRSHLASAVETRCGNEFQVRHL
jgi:hypothetical protein